MTHTAPDPILYANRDRSKICACCGDELETCLFFPELPSVLFCLRCGREIHQDRKLSRIQHQETRPCRICQQPFPISRSSARRTCDDCLEILSATR